MTRNYPFSTFKYGVINKLPIQSLPDGAAYDSLNWLTEDGQIALRHGYKILGNENTGNGRISGLGVGKKRNNTEIPFRTRGQKAEYYDSVSDTWIEISTDMLGSAADGEDVSIQPYDSNSGPQVWLNSPNSGPKKIMVANPGDYTSVFDATINYKALMRIKQNRMFLFNITNSSTSTDKSGVRLSSLNTKNLSDYTQIVAEVLGAGTGSQTTFTGTLAFKAADTKRTCLSVSATDGTETFNDDGSGLLVGSLGGTGTINYTSGAISITFNTAVTNSINVTVTYRWENSNSSGISNFVVPGSRVAGDPDVFVQGEGGDFQNLFSLNEIEYCAHTKKFWKLTLTLDDTKATNYIYREHAGIPYFRAGVETEGGIYAVDVSDANNPKFVLIKIASNSTEVKPTLISTRLDLTGYQFDKAAAYTFNDYILFSCRTNDSTVNNRVWVYNTRFGLFDLADYYVSAFENYGGTLIAGDSVSNNVQTLLSGFDDNGDLIYNYWKSGVSRLGFINARGKKYPIPQLKRNKKLQIEGLISPAQVLRVYVALDRGNFVEVVDPNDTSTDPADLGAFIKGTGAYVDRSQAVTIGSTVMGSKEIGGGSDGVEVYHYKRILPFGKDKFSDIQIMLQAVSIGYVSVTLLEFRDIRVKQDKPARKYRQ